VRTHTRKGSDIQHCNCKFIIRVETLKYIPYYQIPEHEARNMLALLNDASNNVFYAGMDVNNLQEKITMNPVGDGAQ